MLEHCRVWDVVHVDGAYRLAGTATRDGVTRECADKIFADLTASQGSALRAIGRVRGNGAEPVDLIVSGPDAEHVAEELCRTYKIPTIVVTRP